MAARKSGITLRRAHRVGHQRAASGPEFDDAHVLRRTHLFPDRGHPQPDHLAEHLADLGRGDEIAGGAERFVGEVISVFRMRETKPHVFGERHWSGDVDQPSDFGFERREIRSSAIFLRCSGWVLQCIGDQADPREDQRNAKQHCPSSCRPTENRVAGRARGKIRKRLRATP